MKSYMPRSPLKKIEEIIKKIVDNPQNKEYLEQKDDLNFLKEIGIISKNKIVLTERGKEFFTKHFVQNDVNESKKILSELMKKHPATQAICQILWGRQTIKKEHVYNLLKLNKLINYNSKMDDIASFLMILNYCEIINYSKKTQKIKINHNLQSQIVPETIFLKSDNPYGNILNLKKVIRDCKKYIYWFDKNFGVKGLEILYSEVDGNNIKSIKILTSLDQNVNKNMKSEFERFQEEMKTKGIQVEMRVLIEKESINHIHDRWIIAENVRYNVPPINSIFQNQTSEIKKTNNLPPFNEWWEKGLSIIEEFTKITNKKEEKVVC